VVDVPSQVGQAALAGLGIIAITDVRREIKINLVRLRIGLNFEILNTLRN
jgi:hypothetical protein